MTPVYLRIYLNDHDAGSVAGLELARRCLGNNPGGALGELLSVLLQELREDRAILHRVMEEVGAWRNPLKLGASWFVEKLTRLKGNGHLLRYSPLSRLLELEALCAGIYAKERLWRALPGWVELEPRLVAFEFESLAERAASQRARLEPFRLAAALEAARSEPVTRRIFPGRLFGLRPA
ncbi:MAG: hypothetical protein ACYC8T_02855 [Myxococcaceae bacterium]